MMPRRWRAVALRVLGLAVLAAGVGVWVLGRGELLPQMIMAGSALMCVYLARCARNVVRRDALPPGAQVVPRSRHRRAGRRSWISAAASVVAVVITYQLIDADALQGAQAVWPVYLFAAAAVWCAVAVPYLLMRFASLRD